MAKLKSTSDYEGPPGASGTPGIGVLRQGGATLGPRGSSIPAGGAGEAAASDYLIGQDGLAHAPNFLPGSKLRHSVVLFS